MSFISKIEAAISQTAQSVQRALDHLELSAPQSYNQSRLALFESAATEVFASNCCLLALVTKEFGPADYLDANTVAKIDKASDFIFKMAARRFFYIAAINDVKFEKGTRGRKLNAYGYPKAGSAQAL